MNRGDVQAAIRFPAIVAAIMLLLLAPSLSAAPSAEPWPLWETHDPASQVSIDHRDWGFFLDAYLVTDHPAGVNLVRYSQVTASDRKRLQDYIGRLEATAISKLNRDEQLAYWTNLYNAVTVEVILEHYPVSSIRDIKISGPIYNRNPWDAKRVTVEGVGLTLNDIEHRILRPIWNDPRIHYVVNCASFGCPNLQRVPFTAENWNELADLAASEYINHPRGIDLSGSTPVFSSIYDWYVADFDGSIGGVVVHATRYADAEQTRALRAFSSAGYQPKPKYEYTWKLNAP